MLRPSRKSSPRLAAGPPKAESTRRQCAILETQSSIMLFMCPADAHYRPRPELTPALRLVAGRNQKRSVMMLLQLKNSVLDLWFEGPHNTNPHEHDAEAKRNGMTNRDQVMAVVRNIE